MTNIKRPRIPIGVKPRTASSNILDKLNIPNIQITRFRSYQHRTKEWNEAGYSGRVTDNGDIRLQKRYNLTVKGFEAWRIGIKNNHQVTVNIVMHFTVHDKYGLVNSFTETYNNLRPGEPAEMVIKLADKRTRIKMETVGVYAGFQLLSSTEVRTFMPPRTWSKVHSLLLILSMVLISLGMLTDQSATTISSNGLPVIIPLFAFFIATGEAFNITSVFCMFFLMLMLPFAGYSTGGLMVLMIMGCTYLWVVWKKRYSLKDFLIGAFISKSS
jgi:hypothetical protein